MKWRVCKSSLRGRVQIPPSKSHTLRAILFALMAKGTSYVRNYLTSPDAEAMIRAIRAFRAKVEVFPDHLKIEGVAGVLQAADDVIDCGNSGQVLRFIGALSSLAEGYTVLTGDHSIRHNRPVKPLLEALQKLGAFAVSSKLNGYAPVIIRGPLKPGKTSLEGQDSQPVSGMLIATAFAEGASEITVSHPGEKPWIELTLSWFDRLGIRYENHAFERYKMLGGASYQGFDYSVPGDFSSSAFPIAAALVTHSELTLENIDMTDVQGDKELILVLQKLGAKIDIHKNTLRVHPGSSLEGGTIDINRFIDAITILAVMGCFAKAPLEITNAGIARAKECDRISAICTELKKMGAKIEEKKEGLIVYPSRLHGAHLQTYKDHRMVMSLTVAAMAAEGESIIEGVDAVKKTYPSFYEDFRALGAKIECL